MNSARMDLELLFRMISGDIIQFIHIVKLKSVLCPSILCPPILSLTF